MEVLDRLAAPLRRAAGKDVTAPAAVEEKLPKRPQRMPLPVVPRLRGVLAVVAAGAALVVLAVLSDPLFELDRFIAPKELVLHATALVALLGVLRRYHRPGLTWFDGLLVGVLALGLASALLAPNPLLGLRALAVSVSATAMFWVGRALARDGLGRAAAALAAAGMVAFALTALAQAYGVESPYFSLRRSPGGTLGNRNSVAHLAAVGAPLVLVLGLGARRAYGALLAGPVLGVLAAVLVLTRSRAAWMAVLAAGAVFVLAYLLRRGRWALPPLRVALVAAGLVGGVAAAAFVPNTLRWRSASPYLDTAAGLVNYREGSGAGRLVQYRRTARMALDHAVLGVGPGNWPVVYPRYAVRRDPSLDGSGMTANAWPSSDVAAVISERGLPATLGLGVAVVALLVAGLARVRRAEETSEAVAGAGRAAVLAAAVVAGGFDAVLLLPAAALLVPLAVGALAPAVPLPEGDPPPPRARRRALRWAVLVVGGVGLAQGGARVASMVMAAGADARWAQEVAVALDPGGYRTRIRLAERYARAGDCAATIRHASTAQRLYPEAPLPRRLLRRCGVR